MFIYLMAVKKSLIFIVGVDVLGDPKKQTILLEQHPDKHQFVGGTKAPPYEKYVCLGFKGRGSPVQKINKYCRGDSRIARKTTNPFDFRL